MTPLTDLRGRTALVTGAAGGIGRRVAGLLAEAGAAVCLADRDDPALARALRQLRAESGPSTGHAHADLTGHAADVTDPAALQELVEVAAGPSGALDIVVAAAGQMSTGGVRDTSPSTWEYGLRTNLTSAFLTCQAAIPALERARSGRIVLLSSGAGTDPRTVTGVSYAVAKAGIIHLGRMLAVELAGTGITVNTVAPGPVDTAMARGFGDEVLARYAERTPLGRIATPDDVARAVLFLVTDLGGFVNGEVIRVAGGP